MGVCDHADFLHQGSDVAVSRIVASTACLSVWGSVIVPTFCNRCQMWRSEDFHKMQALWLHLHCVCLSDCMGVCDPANVLQQVSDVVVRRLLLIVTSTVCLLV